MALGQLQALHQLFAALVSRHALKSCHHPQIAVCLVAIHEAQQRRFNPGTIAILPSRFAPCKQLQLLTKLIPHWLDHTRQPPAFLRAALARNRRCIIGTNFRRDVVERCQVRQAADILLGSFANSTFYIEPQIVTTTPMSHYKLRGIVGK